MSVLEPLDDHVLVLPDPVANPNALVTDLGDVNKILVVRDTLGPRHGDTGTGVVVRTGPGHPRAGRALTVLAGHRVLFSLGAGHTLKVDGVPYRMFREREIMGTLDYYAG